MVGHRLVRTITERDRDRRRPVTVIGAELRPAHDGVALFSCVDGRSARDLALPALDVVTHLGGVLSLLSTGAASTSRT
jgi:NAD(P)H-nitrite reductase large subunit